MGTIVLHLAGSGSTTKSGFNPTFFIFILFAVGVFYMLLVRPQRARQRRVMQTQNQVIPGQRIRTTAGMYATIVSGDDRDVVIEIAPGVEVTMLRRAVMDVVSDDAMPTHEDIGEDGAEEPEEDAEEEQAEAPGEPTDAAPGDDPELKDRNV